MEYNNPRGRIMQRCNNLLLSEGMKLFRRYRAKENWSQWPRPAPLCPPARSYRKYESRRNCYDNRWRRELCRFKCYRRLNARTLAPKPSSPPGPTVLPLPPFLKTYWRKRKLEPRQTRAIAPAVKVIDQRDSHLDCERTFSGSRVLGYPQS